MRTARYAFGTNCRSREFQKKKQQSSSDKNKPIMGSAVINDKKSQKIDRTTAGRESEREHRARK